MKQAAKFNPGKIGVLLGGDSSEREISIKSGQAVLRALESLGLDATAIGINEDISEGLEASSIDVAFVVLHGRFGEDGQVQALLESKNIPYTGSGVSASRLAMDKFKSRQCFKEAGLTVPDTVSISKWSDRISLPFSFPVVVKPSREGSSIGLSLASDRDELRTSCLRALEFDQVVLIEPFIAGMECTSGILGDIALPLVEIVPSNPFFDFEAKYTKGKTEFMVPARLEESLAQRAREVGLTAHQALGCKAYSRVDLIIDRESNIFVLEVNTIPGFTPTSLFPMACSAAGINFPQLCLELLWLAVN